MPGRRAGKRQAFDSHRTCPLALSPTAQEKKKALQEEEERDQALQAKASLAIPLVPESEDDRRLAALLKFHTLDCALGGLGARGAGWAEMGVPQP